MPPQYTIICQVIRVWTLSVHADTPDKALAEARSMTIENIESQGSLSDATTDYFEVAP